MEQQTAIKMQLYPNRAQAVAIAKNAGCCRFVYNHFLARRKEEYLTNKQTLNHFSCMKELPALKKEYDWLKEANSQTLQ